MSGPYCSEQVYGNCGWKSEAERLREFAFGSAPEWEKADSTLKHRVRELEAEVESLRAETGR